MKLAGSRLRLRVCRSDSLPLTHHLKRDGHPLPEFRRALCRPMI
jgi:hypothetical protein